MFEGRGDYRQRRELLPEIVKLNVLFGNRKRRHIVCLPEAVVVPDVERCAVRSISGAHFVALTTGVMSENIVGVRCTCNPVRDGLLFGDLARP